MIDGAEYVERHSVPGHLGRTLADGWSAFDNGTIGRCRANRPSKPRKLPRSDNERAIAHRLRKLAHCLREWVERNGIESESRTQHALLEVEKLFLAEEDAAITNFASQMPSTETYLKAMGQGLVQVFANSNTAALRILFAQYILSGVLDAHDGLIDDARFWRAGPSAPWRNMASATPRWGKFDDFIERRQALLAAQDLLNNVGQQGGARHH